MIDLARKLARLGRPRILVVGDLVRDVDVHGRTARYAPEAAGVPVFEEERREERPGGAGAVAAMGAALGADVALVHAAGPAVKTRLFVGGRPVLRHDAPPAAVPPARAGTIEREVAARLAGGRPAAVLVADYGFGTCTAPALRAAIDGAAARGIPCLVDPARGTPWAAYRGCTAVKCNEPEWTAQKTYDHQPAKLIITAGAKGMVYCPAGIANGHSRDIPARPRNAADVTGAGDMVLAALGVCVACGLDWPDACRAANAAAGLKVERHGAAPVSRAEVVADLVAGLKVLPADLLPAVAQAQRDKGRRVVFANGCFDLLHPGHLALLAAARAAGDYLIVGLNSDAGVRRLKGPGRPVLPEADRAAALAALAWVDAVCLFDAPDPAALLELVRPAVYVQGEEYRGRPRPGAEHAGEVVFVPRRPGLSTTAILARREAP